MIALSLLSVLDLLFFRYDPLLERLLLSWSQSRVTLNTFPIRDKFPDEFHFLILPNIVADTQEIMVSSCCQRNTIKCGACTFDLIIQFKELGKYVVASEVAGNEALAICVRQ